MKKLLMAIMLPLAAHSQTIEQCQRAAEANYPLIRQYGLIKKTTAITVDNIAKGWLPQVTASAQATLQSDVARWPDQVQTLYQQMGLDMRGLRRDQYRIGVDVNQTLYEGGIMRSKQEVAARQGIVEETQTEVAMYQLRRRVNEMYFSLLLLDEQLKLNSDLQELLVGKEKKLKSMVEHGTAAESDYKTVMAERLCTSQQGADLSVQRHTVALVLSALCGMEVKEPKRPTMGQGVQDMGQENSIRPELRVFNAQLQLADAQEKLLNAGLKPRVSLFASAFYGYPGYNMFKDMMQHKWTMNAMVGARITWNIGALYTRKNDMALLDRQREKAELGRGVFLFDNNLEQLQQDENIKRYRTLLASDESIIGLRRDIRKAAESKLEHGIIDVNDLLKEIKAENAAMIQHSVHEIEMLKEIYNLKFTTNK